MGSVRLNIYKKDHFLDSLYVYNVKLQYTHVDFTYTCVHLGYGGLEDTV